MCPGGMCTVMGNSGYEYAYGDMGPGTTYCAGSNEACLKGTTSPVNPPAYTYYGIALGINLGPAMGMNPPAPVQLMGSGMTVKLSNIPPGGARVVLTVAGADYCAPITTNPITIPWGSFNTKCYDSPPDGLALATAPATPHIEVQAVSDMVQEPIDFCVEEISWQ
jgi:hypothetical protein